MSLLILQTPGHRVMAVRLDDPSPGYAASYAEDVASRLGVPVMWAEVNVASVVAVGPDEIADDFEDDEPQFAATEWQEAMPAPAAVGDATVSDGNGDAA